MTPPAAGVGEGGGIGARRLNKPFVFLAPGVSICSCVHSGDRKGRNKKRGWEIERDGEMFVSMAVIAAALTGSRREAAKQEGCTTEPDSKVTP